jgi:hypothetical protein
MRVCSRHCVPVFHDHADAPASSGQSLVQALKADTLSLIAWQVGMYGWMALMRFVIFGKELPKTDPSFWFLMQIGMAATPAPKSATSRSGSNIGCRGHDSRSKMKSKLLKTRRSDGELRHLSRYCIVQFPKSYAIGITIGIAVLVVVVLIGLYFYMQLSLHD